MIRFIWAEDEDGHIGYQGTLPWHLPADLRHFKDLTSNHVIVMGRRTFESFPDYYLKDSILFSRLVQLYSVNTKIMYTSKFFST